MVSNRKKSLSTNVSSVHAEKMEFNGAITSERRTAATGESVLASTSHSKYNIKIKEEVGEESPNVINNFEETIKMIKEEVADDSANAAISPMQMTIYESDEIKIKEEPQLDISDVFQNELTNESSQKYSCSHCDFEIDVKYYLDIHNEMMHSHEKDCESTDPDDFACPHCDHRANNKYGLKRHKLSKHVDGEKRYACYICDFSATNILVLQSHRECHTRGKLYSCPHCKTFTSSSLSVMRTHERKHLSEMSNHKLIFCAHCDYRTYFKYCLKVHSKVHLIEKPPEPMHPCTLCDFQTKRLRVLRVHHRRIHLREEPFICPTCKHAFSSSGSLSRHIKTHSKEEHSIQCTECDYKTLQYSSMKGHMKTHSKPPTTYECAHCDFRTSRKAQINIHVKVHRATNACSYCDFKTHHKTVFRRHRCPSKKQTKASGGHSIIEQ